MKPYCFVLMPFGRKLDDSGRTIDFDAVFRGIIAPAIRDAGLEPIRADEETAGGFIHKPMFERLMLCDYAVADLTTANPNVFYELGIRHGIRPHTTVLLYAKGMRLPFDVGPLRALPYQLSRFGRPAAARRDRTQLKERLIACRNPVVDSPLFQLIADFPRADIARLKTDTFRELVEYSQNLKQRLEAARREGREAVARVEAELDVRDADPAVVVDLLLSYRAVGDWQAMIDLVPKMSPVLARAVLVQEQLGFALNRAGRRREAERVLLQVITEHGASSETNGLLGRVYKDMWLDARRQGETVKADGLLRRAIRAYLDGFEADWRDAYPGVNAVTLMELGTQVDPRQAEILPVVRYSVNRRLSSTKPDYWDYATRLELDVIGNDRQGAWTALEDALVHIREQWEPLSTAGNLNLICEARKRRGSDHEWIAELEAKLREAADSMD